MSLLLIFFSHGHIFLFCPVSTKNMLYFIYKEAFLSYGVETRGQFTDSLGLRLVCRLKKSYFYLWFFPLLPSVSLCFGLKTWSFSIDVKTVEGAVCLSEDLTYALWLPALLPLPTSTKILEEGMVVCCSRNHSLSGTLVSYILWDCRRFSCVFYRNKLLGCLLNNYWSLNPWLLKGLTDLFSF